jgi:hypothetical protein
MGGDAFVVLLAIGALLVAVWLDHRLGERRPSSPVRRVAHAVAAFVVLQLATAGSAYVVHRNPTLGHELIALFALFLPSLIYAFLSGLWLMRTLADVARLARH